ncbi:hypothetical protein [Tropicimonas sp. S265A]|uniref:hypothetical protein n=1 Tax=Tropicimonas sp. S265A TaxID=3415134 RepID=UPI003C7B1D28
MIQKFKTTIYSVNNPPITSIAANVILGLAMLGAVLIGTNDFSVRSLAYDLGETLEVQGTLSASPALGSAH